jgi:uncharacterized paraquat-inducible protein A
MALLDEPLANEENEQFGLAHDKLLYCHQCDSRYKQPRILQCLHVFCTSCLEQLSTDDDDGSKAASDG